MLPILIAGAFAAGVQNCVIVAPGKEVEVVRWMASPTKQHYPVSWITLLRKAQNHLKSGIWTEVKRAVLGFTLCTYPADAAFTWVRVDC